MTTRARAIWMLVVANLFWGLSFPLIKGIGLLNARLAPEADGWFVTVYTILPRFLIALPVLALWIGRDCLRITRGEWIQGTMVALFGAAGMLLQNDGMRFTHASTSAFLTQFYAIVIPVWVAIRTKRMPPAKVWVCCALVLAGVGVLSGMNPGDVRIGRGELETLGASLFFMMQIFWVEKKSFGPTRPLRVAAVLFLVEVAIFGALAVAFAPEPAALARPWADAGWLGMNLALGLLCTVGAFGLMLAWQPIVTATEAGLLYCMEPVIASALALFLPSLLSGWTGISYPNERFTFNLLLGGGLVTAAYVLLYWRPSETARS